MITLLQRYITMCLMLLLLPSIAHANIWQLLNAQSRQSGDLIEHYFLADNVALRQAFASAPQEQSGDFSYLISIPMPDGSLVRYQVVESSIMEAELAQQLPRFKTYKLIGVDDSGATGRVSISSHGLMGLFNTAQGQVHVQATDTQLGTDVYRSTLRSSQRSGLPGFLEKEQLFKGNFINSEDRAKVSSRLPGSYLTYRLAMAATNEYVSEAGSAAAAQTEIAIAVNQVNQIYETDFGIRLILIGNNLALLGGNELSNNVSETLLGEIETWIDCTLSGGDADYDIGHLVANSNTGGLAFLGAVCDDQFKAHAVSSLNNPIGNMNFYVDYLAHEFGHQFGAEHTFNGSTSACVGDNRVATSAVEPGSGSSIMSYSGICGSENLQFSSDAAFHAKNIEQVNSFANSQSCQGFISNSNTDPAIATIFDRVIPKSTPFVLDNATASDINGDNMTFSWEQLDTGAGTNSTTLGDDLGSNPLFRSFLPQSISSRDFPALGVQLKGKFDKAEVLPCFARNMNFRLTVRDGKSGQVTDDVSVAVDGSSGPFKLTSQNANIALSPGSVTVTWDVANTNVAPVNCPTVDIELLTFDNSGHSNYSVQPLAGGSATANDGSANVTLPDISNFTSRFRIKCSNNIFYDISDGNINVTGTTPVSSYSLETFFNPSIATETFVDPALACATPRPASASFDSSSITASIVPDDYSERFAAAGECQTVKNTAAAGSGDSGAVELWWLALLAGLTGAIRLFRNQGLQ